jgi:branched-chain amino acid transport system permease protein
MDIFVNLTVAGLATGMMYYLLSSGLSLIYGLMGVLNFAHGSVFMYGCYAGVLVFSLTGILHWELLQQLQLVQLWAG